jgi:hypothetical protein
MKNWTIFTAESIFTFGKHQGKTLEQVAQCDAPYILWCVRNIDKFLIEKDAFLDFQKKYEKSFVTICSPTNDEFERTTNFYEATEQDLDLLENKWNNYTNQNSSRQYADYDHYEDYSVDRNPFYNDNLDMDQQDQEFWDSL